VEPLTHRAFEEMVGKKVDAKIVMFPIGADLWHKLSDGSWERYPDYPAYPSEKNE
jgi:hypothetical protein